jgi:flagellar FlgN protein
VIAAPDQHRVDAELSAAVLAHLDVQIASARRLLGTILAQGAAIRARDVETVIGHLAEVKTEMGLRADLEEQRTDLLVRAGIALGVPAPQVTLDGMTMLMPANEAARARQRSAELRGLLAEIAREHGINRALMRQELAFLDHLVRLIGQEPDTGYRPGGNEPGPNYRVIDAQA